MIPSDRSVEKREPFVLGDLVWGDECRACHRMMSYSASMTEVRCPSCKVVHLEVVGHI